MLTGEELVEKGAVKCSMTLPESSHKLVKPSGTWLEKKQIEATLETRKKVLDVQKIEKRGSLAFAEWDDVLGKAKVTQNTGGHWHWLGHVIDQQLYAYPEEALFLMELGLLHLSYNGAKVSLQQAYSILLKGQIDLFKYQVYANLSKKGYKVVRFDETLKYADDEIGDNNKSDDEGVSADAECEMDTEQVDSNNRPDETKTQDSPEISYKEQIIYKLKNKLKTLKDNSMKKTFGCVPSMYRKHEVIVEVSNHNLIPKNSSPISKNYKIDLNRIKTKNVPVDDNSHSPVTNRSNVEINYPTYNHQNPNRNIFSCPYRTPFNYVFNYCYRPPNFSASYFVVQPRFNFNRHRHIANHYRRKQNRRDKFKQLHTIRNIVRRIKLMRNRGFDQRENINALVQLIDTYNYRYHTNLQIDNDLNLNENIVETIELDKDEPPAKKSRNLHSYEEHLSKLKDLAHKLKELATNNQLLPKHKGVFSNVVKKFNKMYKSDISFDDNYDLVDTSLIISDSSDSDCVVEEVVPKKIVRNPFSRYSNKNLAISEEPTTSTNTTSNINVLSNELTEIFGSWLPKENDFGEPVIAKKDKSAYAIEKQKETFLNDFLRNYNADFQNWSEVKLSFWESIDEEPIEQPIEEVPVLTETLANIEDCTSLGKVLEKLRIIPKADYVFNTKLKIDFDIYGINAQIKKSNRVAPDFHVCCLRLCDPVPSCSDIAALQLMSEAPLIFAPCALGAVSYLQMDDTELPVYINN